MTACPNRPARRRLWASLPVVLALTLSACGRSDEPRTAQGYIEADYLYVAPQVTGRIVALLVRDGEHVRAGQALFRLDDDEAKAVEDQAAAKLAETEARLADLRLGQRKEEIAVIEAQLAEAEAQALAAEREFHRLEALRRGDVVTEGAFDRARAAYQGAQARVAALKSQVMVARLPARSDTLVAAENAVLAAKAALAQASWRRAQHTLTAPADASVHEILFRPGEVANAGRPVVSLLPPDARKVRFFVPQAAMVGLALGQQVSVTCDGCTKPVTAEIDFMSDAVEFTPPVIYSLETRDKLVFKIEARLLDRATSLPIGLPVTVHYRGPER